jgi:RNA polymerase sigma-70 factor (ECF subfamily)
METADIKTLTHNFTTGDGASFADLYEQLVDKVFVFVYYHLEDKPDSIEVTEDVFVDLYQLLQNFNYESDAEFYSLVFSIARHRVAEHRQRYGFLNKFKNRSSRKSLKEPSLKTMLMQIDEASREILILRHWARFSFAEIAILLSMHEQDVTAYYQQAIYSITAFLKEE